MTKIAVIGANGMLGTDLCAALTKTGFDILSFDLPEFDIREKNDILKIVSSADIIVNCAAFTDVDGAEKEKKWCFDINAKAVGLLAENCARLKKYIAHISTDFVFGDNSNAPLPETEKPSPLNTYGQSKLEGENLLLNSGADVLILRIEWTYGLHGKNFIGKILSKAKQEKKMIIVDDQFGSPTWTDDVSRALTSLLKINACGIFHFAPHGYASRFDVANFAIQEAGIKAELLPCSSAAFASPAKRPLNSRFDCSKIDSVLPEKRPEWRDSLRYFIGILKEKRKI